MENRVKVALYARVSTEEQKNHGYSIEAQMDELRRFASENNYDVVNEYIDEGFSGGTLKRPALEKLLDDINHQLIDVVVFVKLDRWFRSVSQYYKIQEILDNNNVEWICTQEDYETITSSGKFKVNIMLSVSQQFKDATSERIRSVFDYKVRNGFYTARSLPIGFALEKVNGGNKVVFNKEEEPLVREILKVFEESKSVRHTIKYINDTYGTNISRKNIDTLLNSPLLHGEYRGIQRFCRGYVTQEKHQELLELKKADKGKKTVAKHDYLFSGLLICPDCGCILVGSKHNSGNTKENRKYQYATYRCNKARNYEGKCKYRKYLYETTIEKYVVENLTNKLTKYINRLNVQNNLNLFELEKQDIIKQMKRLNNIYMKTTMSEREFEFEYQQLQSKLDILSNTNISKHLEIYRQLTDAECENYYFNMSNKDKQQFFKEIIKSIEVEDSHTFNINYIFLP